MSFRFFVGFTLVLTFCVIVLGAYTRLSDAGLGCPDWPGCYGKLLVPANEAAVDKTHYLEQRPLEVGKAWIEMIHRYVAGTLGLCILAIAVWAWRRRQVPGQPVALAFGLLGLVIFQGALGMWTVTLQLKPVVVMAHLLGGFATFSLLWLLWLRSPRGPVRTDAMADAMAGRAGGGPSLTRWRLPGMLALLLLIGQIGLGGWTSTNYAALACPDFPTCHASWWPAEADYREGFVLWRGIGINYEYGVLEHPARVAIHWAHRIGALVTTLVLGWLAFALLRSGDRLRAVGALIGTLLVAQVSLGIGNIVMQLPLSIAVAHNAVAALLLLSLVLLNQRVWRREL